MPGILLRHTSHTNTDTDHGKVDKSVDTNSGTKENRYVVINIRDPIDCFILVFYWMILTTYMQSRQS